jgi:hypothetical protein
MLGFHRRTRSLIPVKDLGRYDKVAMVEEEEEEEERYAEEEREIHSAPDGTDRLRRTQLLLVYLVFAAEA